MAEALCDQLFSDVDGELMMMQHPSDADDLLGSILEAWEDCVTGGGGATPRSAEPEVPQATDSTARASPPKPAAGNVRRMGDRDDESTTLRCLRRRRGRGARRQCRRQKQRRRATTVRRIITRRCTSRWSATGGSR